MGGRHVNDADRRIAARVAAARKAAHLSQTDLANALGVTFQQVQKYERAANRWTAGMLQAAADLIGVPAASFFDAPGAPRVVAQPTAAEARAALREAALAVAEAEERESLAHAQFTVVSRAA